MGVGRGGGGEGKRPSNPDAIEGQQASGPKTRFFSDGKQ